MQNIADIISENFQTGYHARANITAIARLILMTENWEERGGVQPSQTNPPPPPPPFPLLPPSPLPSFPSFALS
ncbi:hypothetical protein T08_6192 [Trichinella sp. T8]|nr:hypothetical protein T08_6192 [Trichinella sp. T8]